ncbi:adenosine deaminase [Breoghania corrubedonensis]|uniref:Adenosine deaminase n=1 Tax=Breoghania corrubedonensis TaxID=665038 RepID=A0A2T5VFH6_9HYPH|nr:adenosine deaminase [Breoghania corrubedonensis]PTW62499.1 adenosine deaminase [Breoghania corrubedonensis]
MRLTAELHCHIEGAAPPDLVRRLGARHGISLDGLFTCRGGYAWHDFTSFLTAYDRAASVFRTPEDYADLAHAHFAGAARNGMIYGEVFISPDHAASSGLSYASYVEGLAAGIARAREETGVEGRMIVVGIRHLGAQAVERAACVMSEEPHPLVTGFGLAGDERVGRAADFARAFKLAGEAGYGLTAHAGEFGGPESVAEVLDCLAVSRIGHGVRAIEDPALVSRLAGEGTVLEVCPGSNIALGLYPGFDRHPIGRLHRSGVAVTISSDDPPFFATTLAREYAETARAQGWGETELDALTRTALHAAFCDEATRERLLARLEEKRPEQPAES